MLSEVLTSLNEVKSRLQERLLQRPEYPALLIVDKAAFQLGEVLALLQPQLARLPANACAGARVAASEAPDEPAQAAADISRLEYPIADAPVPTWVATDESAGAQSCFAPSQDRGEDAPARTVAAMDAPAAASSFERSEEGLEDPPAETVAARDQPIGADVGAIDPILSAVGQAPPPPLRGYLPFFIAPRLTQNSGY